MPKARNPHGLSGKHGDLTFYTRRGKTYYRKNTILDEEKVKNDPAFENSRKAGREFGLAAKLSATFRTSLGGLSSFWGDGMLHERLTAHFNKAFKFLPGKRGVRPVSFSDIAPHLSPFSFRESRGLPFLPPVDVAKNRKTISLDISNHYVLDRFKFPKGISHFSISIAAIILSDLKPWEGSSKYHPIHPALHGTMAIHHSDWYEVESKEELPIGLKISFTFRNKIPDTVSVFFIIGLTLAEEVSNEFYPMRKRSLAFIAGIY